MRSIPLQARPASEPFRSRRLLALMGDDRLAEQLRLGNDVAFEVAFERHGPGILSFCRHMLGSREEAEDAVQHTFAAAHRALLGEEREIALKPWLYAIARNRCVSVLRARREDPMEHCEPSTAGLADEVERRAELRELLDDLADLPAEQRSALLLAEVADLSHAEVAGVLECEVPRVKALVYRARQGLLERRGARETPCHEIREQLANLRGGALRRSELRHHLRRCPGCRAFREQVAQQRGMLAVALPVAPSIGLKSSVLGAVGLGGGSAGGATAVAALGGAGSTAPFASATIAKVAMVGALAGGGAVAGDAVIRDSSSERPQAAPAVEASPGSPPSGSSPAPAATAPAPAGRSGAPARVGKRADERRKGPRVGAGAPGSVGQRSAAGNGARPTAPPARPEKAAGEPARPTTPPGARRGPRDPESGPPSGTPGRGEPPEEPGRSSIVEKKDPPAKDR